MNDGTAAFTYQGPIRVAKAVAQEKEITLANTEWVDTGIDITLDVFAAISIANVIYNHCCGLGLVVWRSCKTKNLCDVHVVSGLDQRAAEVERAIDWPLGDNGADYNQLRTKEQRSQLSVL
jgi:hypothetical protein